MDVKELNQSIKALKQRYVKAKKRQALYICTIAILCLSMLSIKEYSAGELNIEIPELINFDTEFFELDDFAKTLKDKKQCPIH